MNNQLRQIDQDIWCVDSEVRMSVGTYFPCRMTILRLQSGQLLLHSPLPIDDELATEIARLGSVGHLVAPNGFHYLYFGAAAARYPDARTYAAPLLAEKRSEISFDELLSDEPPEAWAGEIDQLLVKGVPKADEVVFFHRKTGTLIVTDLVFNMHTVRGVMTPWVLRMVGAYRKLSQSRLWRAITKDRAAAGKSLLRMFEWRLRRLVVAHGEVVEDLDPAVLYQRLGWMLKDQPKPAFARQITQPRA